MSMIKASIPDVLAQCREQGKYRGHLYSPQNCAHRDNSFLLLESVQGMSTVNETFIIMENVAACCSLK